MIIEITNDLKNYELDLDFIEKFVKDIIKNEYKSDSSKEEYISLLFTNDEIIRELNYEYRNIDAPTDVLTFAYHDEEEEIDEVYDILGDIAISIQRVSEQAIEYGHSFERELFYVITHGVLHTLGYDHIKEEDKEIMRKKEEEILSKYNFIR